MAQSLKNYIANQLRTLRKAKQLRQAQLAELIERTPEAISNIERAKSLPALDTLLAISTALEVPVREFFPDPGVTEDKTANRLRIEAEAISLLRGLSDDRARIALGQIKALAEA